MGPLVNLQVKTSPEVFQTFEEAYQSSQCTTKGQFIELIIESFLNPPKSKTVEVGKKEDQDTIQNLTNEIGRLKIMNDQLNESFLECTQSRIESRQRVDELEVQLNEATGNLQTLKTSVSADNQVTLTIPPIIRKVLEIEASTAKKKTGKEFNFGEILLNSFWESVKVGRVYPWKAWSNSELSNLAKQLQSEGQ